MLAGVQPRGEREEVAFGRHVDEDVLALGRLVQSVIERIMTFSSLVEGHEHHSE